MKCSLAHHSISDILFFHNNTGDDATENSLSRKLQQFPIDSGQCCLSDSLTTDFTPEPCPLMFVKLPQSHGLSPQSWQIIPALVCFNTAFLSSPTSGSLSLGHPKEQPKN